MIMKKESYKPVDMKAYISTQKQKATKNIINTMKKMNISFNELENDYQIVTTS